MSLIKKYQKMYADTRGERVKVYTLSDGRRLSLAEIADAIILSARDEAPQSERWKQTVVVDQIEEELHQRYTALLDGQCTVIDYRSAVDRWLKEGTRKTK